MANIDNAFTVDIISLNDSVLIVSGNSDPSISSGFEAPVGSLYLRTTGDLYRKNNTADVDWVLTGIGGTDELAKVSLNDTTSGFLNGKLVAGTNVTLTETNDGGNETLVINATGGVTDHTLLTNIGTNTHAQIDTHIADTSIHFTQAAISITESQISDLQNYLLNINSLSITELSDVFSSMTPTDGQVLTYDTTNGWQAESVALDLDVAVNVSANDTTAGFLNGKLVAGTNVTFVENNDGGNETLTISSTDTNTTDHTLLTNIGTNTHTQIDTHIADTSIHFTQAAISITESQISDLQNYLLNINSLSITELSDVLTTMTPTDGQVLTYDTTNGWQAESVALDLDVAVNVSANDTTAGFLNGKLVAGAGIAFVENNDGGNETLTISSTSTSADMASATVGRTANIAIPATFTNITFDVTHVENDTSIIEHDNTNTDRILIKDTGLYFISYAMSFDADAGEETISGRVLIDDTTVVPGSLRVASEDDEINDLSNAITAELTSGTYVTLQHSASGAGNVLHSSSNFSVTRAKGTKGADGATGPTGSGSNILIEQDNVLVTNTPHSTLNFQGMGLADAGSGQVDIANIFGSEFQIEQSLGVTTTTSTTFQNKVTMVTPSLPAGTYRLGISYGWNHDNNGNDFEARIQEGGINLGEIHKQEPKDSAGSFSTTATSQRYYISRNFYRTLTTGVQTYTLDFRTDTGGVESSMWDATIELWRVA